ncbi:MAG: trypsin-like peptidase domain-containing protein [Thermosphaera sp.]
MSIRESENVFKELKKKKNVVGMSNSPKERIKGGEVVPGTSVVRVYVERKVKKEKLAPEDLIPPKVVIDGKEYETDVVEIGKINKVSATRKFRPVPAGVSCSRYDVNGAGTIGWFLIDKDNGRLYIMSNNHVFTKENEGAFGDPIVQPGVLDGGNPDTDVVAELYGFVPIDFYGTNLVDVAVAKPVDKSLFIPIVYNLGDVTGVRDPVLNERVYKTGRTTGTTSGVVYDVSATLTIGYDKGSAVFTDVALVQGSNIVGAGDSGSPVLSSDGMFLGMLFAGNDIGSVYVFSKAFNILSELKRALGIDFQVLVTSPKPEPVTVDYSRLVGATMFGMAFYSLIITFISAFDQYVSLLREH